MSDFASIGDAANAVVDRLAEHLRTEARETDAAVDRMADRIASLQASDPYAAWRNSTTGRKPDVDDLPAYQASAGFYRHKSSQAPVAIWPKDGWLVATVGVDGRETVVDDRFCENVFAYLAPVVEPHYWSCVELGVWPDHAVAGHNRGPDGFEALRDLVQELIREADKLVKAGAAPNQEAADAAANLANRLRDLEADLASERKAEERPVLERIAPLRAELDGIKSKFDPWQEAAKVRMSQIKLQVLKPFLIEKRRIERETKEPVKRRGGGEVAPVANAGAKYRRVSLVQRWRAEIKDYDVALKHFGPDPKVREVVQSLADAAARSKARAPVPGVEFIQDEDVR